MGPSAFSGSLANRVDRISTIDHDQDDLECDNREAENVLVYEDNKTENLKNTEMEQQLRILVFSAVLDFWFLVFGFWFLDFRFWFLRE